MTKKLFYPLDKLSKEAHIKSLDHYKNEYNQSIQDQNKFFGRTDYMTPVIFEGEKDIEGKIVPVLITSSNKNNLFGKIKLKKNIKAA